MSDLENQKLEGQLECPKHCVMIPFLNRHDQVARCMDALLTQENKQTVFLLIDDGSTPAALRSVILQPILSHENVHLIHHRENFGVSAARNSGLHWCRQNDIELAIMIDSDCFPDNNVISEHLRLHREHPEAACIGGRIVGEGKGVWATLDGITSWIHASIHQDKKRRGEEELRRVEHPYHLATTNFSVKLSQLPQREFVFDERLISGEDCLLVRELRKNKKSVYFSSTPKILHQDRESCWQVLKHHYEWGHHQYFIQLGGDIAPRCFNPLYRLAFVLGFFPLIPFFALVGSLLNSRALLASKSPKLLFYPLIYMLWFVKGIAVWEAAIRPYTCLRKGRISLEYEQAIFNSLEEAVQAKS